MNWSKDILFYGQKGLIKIFCSLGKKKKKEKKNERDASQNAFPFFHLAQSAVTVEYTDCFSAEG